MSRFASKELQTIDLGDGEWVKIPTTLSYKQVISLTSTSDTGEISKRMLTECIKEWNLKDQEWNIPEVNEENILQLDVPTITILSNAISRLVSNDQDKKK